jgi:hypothetical protein
MQLVLECPAIRQGRRTGQLTAVLTSGLLLSCPACPVLTHPALSLPGVLGGNLSGGAACGTLSRPEGAPGCANEVAGHKGAPTV